ncbi:hypothetical protein J3E72DRAFT_387566 [Bipolaris maydis]|nr:hypothetical protein J3E73DRAFT_383483 [Bipolaris maydis]KAJ5057600.1 hypothetical protein J3E74DRAFT_420464 [Bipolaris maydis]KAJ6194851.1 hypothetical protein J3E72DRAFT_387566 [Bipolaris maydis]KAJ6206909.1 hypothetical protein PSV09DRAFT_2222259 [Bipolaris maydis]KAJ6268570.1 hypothetical protein PSV08DRAFT_364460 [Bipolaris maydis]
MSGLEVAGIVLGAFPLLISGIEHWRDVAKVGGFYWRIRKEYTKCQRDIQFHEIVYKNNLKELLFPLLHDVDEVGKLIANPGGLKWSDKALQKQLERRLKESYQLYLDTMAEMNEIAEELKKELCFGEKNVQDKLSLPETKRRSVNRSPSPQQGARPSKISTAKGKMDYEFFRMKFSVGERIRDELFGQLKECNERLEKLLNSSDRVSALQDVAPGATKKASELESAFKRISKKSNLLFQALQNAWQCSCQQYHFANLRLEHRTLAEACFEIVFMFIAPSEHGVTPWTEKHIRCGHIPGCSSSQKRLETIKSLTPQHQPVPLPTRAGPKLPSTTHCKRVGFAPPIPTVPKIQVDMFVDHNVQLCRRLGDEECEVCMGIVSHDDEAFHLHPVNQKRNQPENGPITLGHVLSRDFQDPFSRRQRYQIALLVASSVAQLQSTPWLRTGLCKEDVIFFPSEERNELLPCGEPFIRQGFVQNHAHLSSTESSADGCNFYALGILLLELCFGCRLEDHAVSKRHPPNADAATKHAFDVMAGLKWSRSVSDESGEDYATAVKWCFTGVTDKEKNWRGEIVRNVIQPLEKCMEHFNNVTVAV